MKTHGYSDSKPLGNYIISLSVFASGETQLTSWNFLVHELPPKLLLRSRTIRVRGQRQVQKMQEHTKQLGDTGQTQMLFWNSRPVKSGPRFLSTANHRIWLRSLALWNPGPVAATSSLMTTGGVDGGWPLNFLCGVLVLQNVHSWTCKQNVDIEAESMAQQAPSLALLSSLSGQVEVHLQRSSLLIIFVCTNICCRRESRQICAAETVSGPIWNIRKIEMYVALSHSRLLVSEMTAHPQRL